jgi:hypothetical protein
MALTTKAQQGWRRATNAARELPSILLVGGIRCGSSSLNRYVQASGARGPLPPVGKEVHFFDRNLARGPGWYRSLYPTGGPNLDDTPSYLCTPGTAARAAQLLPSAKVLAILREPHERALSHFSWRRERGQEMCSTIEEALADEPNRTGEGRSMLDCYDLHSRYDVGLRSWLEHYPAERVCVLIAERLFAGDADELARCDAFLELRPPDGFPHTNAGARSEPMQPLANRYADVVAGVESIIGRPTGW